MDLISLVRRVATGGCAQAAPLRVRSGATRLKSPSRLAREKPVAARREAARIEAFGLGPLMHGGPTRRPSADASLFSAQLSASHLAARHFPATLPPVAGALADGRCRALPRRNRRKSTPPRAGRVGNPGASAQPGRAGCLCRVQRAL